MDSGWVVAGQGLLTLLFGCVCYFLGKRKEQNEREKERAKALEDAKQAREGLRDPAVLERLHTRYKR